ncbi:hypothetical protein DL96DRAFT_1702383 [Flagelloscypha sp. PMI_526]|nr:hypothetical protein DL96DRAFT_1702383 [Flagelloscypha sp. PMI_526]
MIHKTFRFLLKRSYATTSSGLPYLPPTATSPDAFHAFILNHLKTHSSSSSNSASMLEEFSVNASRVLPFSLPYESVPSHTRKIDPSLQRSNLLMIVHALWEETTNHFKVTSSTGFRINANLPKSNDQLVLTCAHTLEEIRRHPLLTTKEKTTTFGSFILSCNLNKNCPPSVYPVTAIVSSLPRSDMLLLRASLPDYIHAFPLNPYPPKTSTPIQAHLVVHTEPQDPGWSPWICEGSWTKWIPGQILSYRDFAGRETSPGTYDDLSYVLFKPIPSNGSSGGPIVSPEGAVVGMISGSGLENRVAGTCGWAVPAETAFEMFSLPGLERKS